MNRTDNLDRVRERVKPWDVVIIGGGATGVGRALDAAARGYDVLLLEQHDFGKGTSSRSTKLIHGGVRYLRQGNISLVREALRERSVLLKNAPHVVRVQEFVVPCYGLRDKLVYGAGLAIYDLLAGKYRLGRSRILSRRETLERLPTLQPEGLSGGVLYNDGQFDDARLLIDMAVTAAKSGAVLLNYARVVGFCEDGTGVRFEDAETGENLEIKALSVINAAGAFCDVVRKAAGEEAEPILTFSQGIHLVLKRKFLDSDTAIMIPTTSDGRVLFGIPWFDYVLVGTTDTPIDGPSLEPKALESEIDFVLETAAGVLTDKPSRSDILSVFAGVRPLVRSRHIRKTSDLSRGHELIVDPSGLITITGGKWTTYRRMAMDAVDKAIETGGLDRRPCKTANIKIIGKSTFGADPDAPEISRFVHEEMARTVEDVLARRTRMLFLDARSAVRAAPMIARLIAAELGRDNEWIERQIDEFTDVAENYTVE